MKRKQPPTVGEQIYAARIRCGWTQAQLGKRVGRAQHHISAIEAGTNSSSVSTLEPIAAALGIRLVIDGRK